MPISFTLCGDEVQVRYSGSYFYEYKAVVKSFDFPRFNVKAKAWVFPINHFKRMIPILSTLPETPTISDELRQRMVEDKVAAESAKELRQAMDSTFAPEGFRGTLLPFQAIGANFFVEGKRAVLCDDVGLGKTAQAIAGICHLFDTETIENALIICPGHLKRQWASEIEKFSYYESMIIEGARDQREWKFKNGKNIFITNYELLSRDPEYLAQEWGVIILDEAQEIKNYRTQAAKLCRQLISRYKWAMTATPLENNLPELHSIFEFVYPGVLGQWHEFERRFVDRNVFGGIRGYRNLDQLREMVKPYFLRRKVDDCLSDFTEKDSKIVTLDFLPEEAVIYKDVDKQVVQTLSEERMQRLNHSMRMTQVGYLRQACDHTTLVSPEFNYPSVKLNWLKEVVADVKERGEQLVIFSEWKRMVKLISKELGGCPMLHGDMGFAERHATIARWKTQDQPLIATDCANVGLNLQHANWLINYEMHWNPAVMKQRIGRVHRLTQDKIVRVRAPMIRDSIEVNVLESLTGKTNLFKDVIDALASKAKKVSRNDRGSVK